MGYRTNQEKRTAKQDVVLRALTLQYAGVRCHVITRGGVRREVFDDHGHYQRLADGLEAEVLRSQGQIISYCWTPNHIHLLVRTQQPNHFQWNAALAQRERQLLRKTKPKITQSLPRPIQSV